MAKKSFLFFLLFLCVIFSVKKIQAQDVQRYSFSDRQMGTLFRITFYASDDSTAKVAAQKAFDHAEKLNSVLSDYEAGSNLNRLALRSGNGKFVPVHPDLFCVISKAQEVARQSEGAFDITAGPYIRLWRTIRRAAHPELPSSKKLDSLRKKVGYEYLTIDSTRSAIALERSNMQLDLGGIAKGYAADEILRILQDMDITSALIDAGGDIRAGDPPPGEAGWTILLPVHNKKGQRSKLRISLANRAVATSGDLFQYVEINGRRFSHIVNPHTGLGLTSQSRVTVVAPDGISADSYASAVSVLGARQGRSFMADKPNAAMRIEYRDEDTDEVIIDSSPAFETFTVSGSKTKESR